MFSFGIYYSIYCGFSFYQIDNNNKSENEYKNGKEICNENLKQNPNRIEMHNLDENQK